MKGIQKRRPHPHVEARLNPPRFRGARPPIDSPLQQSKDWGTPATVNEPADETAQA